MRFGSCALLRYEARKKSKTRAREMRITGAIISATQHQLVSVLVPPSAITIVMLQLENALKRLILEYPVVTIRPVPLTGYKNHQDSKDVFSYECLQVAGPSMLEPARIILGVFLWPVKGSRLELSRYASSFSLTLAPSVDIAERLQSLTAHQNQDLLAQE